MKDLKLVIVSGSNCSPEFQKYHQEIHLHWKKMWETTFRELDGDSSVRSENFTKQDEIVALFHQEQCVAMVCHRLLDNQDPSWDKDPYFETWPQETIQKVNHMSGTVVIGNQISIDPSFRKMPGGGLMKDLLLWFSLRRLLDRKVDFILGAVREDKGLDQLFVSHGAEILKAHVIQHNVPVALLYFEKDTVKLPKEKSLRWESVYRFRSEDPILTRKDTNPAKPRENVMRPLDQLLRLHEEEMQKTAEMMNSSPWENQKFYEEWCAQFYYFVAHATRLLAASASRLYVDKDQLHLRFLDHCQEEKNHEKLFEKDLKAFGKKPSDFQEHPLAALLYQSQYYLIDYVNPMALFGSILFLEGMSISAGPEVYQRLKAKYGDQACNFVKVHVHDDEDHIVKAKKALENLSEQELKAITTSYRQSSYAFNTLLLELKARHQGQKNLKAA